MADSQSKKIREPLVHLTKRSGMHPAKAWGIRLLAVALGLLVCGIVAFLLVDKLLMGNDSITLMVDAVVCLTLAVTVVIAKLVGCALPMAAKALKLDPAVMASPFISTIVDALSLLVYFLFAKALLGV